MEYKEQTKNKKLFRINNSIKAEVNILFAGLAMSFIGIVFLSLSWFWMPETSQILVAVTATNVVFGRAAGMSLGYTLGLEHIVVIPINMLIETILVFLFYPLFVFSWNSLLVVKGLKKFMERTRKAALIHQRTIHKYGFIGLFIFVWSPFWMTGPVVGCAIGYLLGMRPLYNLSVVLSGTYIAIICWAIVLQEIHNRIAAYGPFAPIVMLLIIIIIVIASRFLASANRKKNF